MSLKHTLLEAYKQAIRRNEKIAEYSKPCDARKKRIRALERDLLRKRNEELRKKINKRELINVPRIMFPVGTEVLIKGKIVGLKVLDDRFVENVVKLDYDEQIIVPNDAIYIKDEPETGHADEAPRYVKNILARLRELPVHDREVWLKAIMGEFEKDFSHAKWREGHEQGKLEGAWVGNQLKDADKIRRELSQVKVPQFIDEFITEQKKLGHTLSYSIDASMSDIVAEWYWDNPELFALAWIFGCEVEEEKRYRVKLKSNSEEIDYLVDTKANGFRFYSNIYTQRREHTRKELEEAGFGWVFDCEGVEVQEVE